MSLNITTIILTLNEEQDLPRCLDSLHWCDTIFIVDSGSTDNTITIARERGCRIYTHPWPGFAAQRNWALNHTDITSDWVLFIDADEVVPQDLVENIKQALQSDKAAFYLTFKVMMFDKWVKRSSNYPVWHPRLCKVGHVTFEEASTGHGETWQVDGDVGYVTSPYIHYCFSKGFTQWLAKHNRLSSMECDAYYELDYNVKSNLQALFARDKHKRRQALRQLSFRLPMRPALRFMYSYVFKGGFFEGRPGLIYCLLYFIYEMMIQVKMMERLMTHKRR